MTKVYTMNALMRALLQVKEEHPLNSFEEEELKNESIVGLVRQIANTKESELRSLAYTLNSREIRKLIIFLAQNENCHNNIVFIMKYVMDSKVYNLIFHCWENHPLHKKLFTLLCEYDTNEYHSEDLPVKIGLFRQWVQDNLDRLFIKVSYYVYERTIKSSGNTFLITYNKMGFTPDTALSTQAFIGYLSFCDKMQFLQKNFDSIFDEMLSFAPNVQTKDEVMRNFLKQLSSDKNTLIKYSECFDHFYRRWGKPELSKRLLIGEDTVFDTYLWWYNYRTIIDGFAHDGDKRRIDFWKQFLKACQVERIKNAQLLIMKFNHYVVVESESIGTLYFYADKEFNGMVMPNLLAAKSKSACKSWMKNESKFVYAKTHLGYWERDVIQHLKLFHMI